MAGAGVGRLAAHHPELMLVRILLCNAERMRGVIGDVQRLAERGLVLTEVVGGLEAVVHLLLFPLRIDRHLPV